MPLAEYMEKLIPYLKKNDPDLFQKVDKMIVEAHPSIPDILDEAYMYSLFFSFEKSVERLKELINKVEEKVTSSR